MQSIVETVKKHRILILILGFAYAAELIFPAFGPGINAVAEGEQATLMSSWSMLFLILSFSIQPKRTLKKQYYLPVMVLIVGFLFCFFIYLPAPVQWLLLALLGIAIGQIGVFWSGMFLKQVSVEERGKVVGASLFVSYGILYLCNAAMPAMPKALVPMIPGLLLWLSMLFLFRYRNVEEMAYVPVKHTYQALPWAFFVLIFIIYLTAGITYAGIYPALNIYPTLERYYNVLPFVTTVLGAGYIADRFGRKYLIFLGVIFLGFSFTFYTLPHSAWTYFLTQTTLQPGWAFMDAYVWIAAADLAIEKNDRRLQAYGVATFLSGTLAGSLIAYRLGSTTIGLSPYYGIITHLPLFVAVALMLILPDATGKRKIIWHQLEQDTQILHPLMAEKLTPREKEIAELLIRNKTGNEICDMLNITNNTLKTHSRNIYKKLEVSNKRELQNKLRHHI